MDAGIYCRISDDRVGAGLGVQRQEADCRALADRRGWSVSEVYVDNDISAYSGRDRPAYRRLVEDVRARRIVGVIAWHPDRLHRRPIELEEFIAVIEETGCLVETVQAGAFDLSSPTGRAVARTVGAWARFESEHKSARIRRKHEQLAAEGRAVGSGRPFGYELDRITVRESEADLIREAAKRVLADEPVRSICLDWTRRGVTSATGRTWSVFGLRRVLMSARISGRREYRRTNGQRVLAGTITATASWPGIITTEESDRLRTILGDPNRRVNWNARSYLLTGGIARCGLCNRPMVARPRSDGRRSYVCASGPGFSGCGKIRSLADPLEELVTETVLRAVDQGALVQFMSREREQVDAAAADELERVNAKLADLAQDFATDLISRNEWLAARETLMARADQLERRLASQSSSGALRELRLPLAPAWHEVPLHVRRALLTALIESVTVAPAVKGRNFFDPARVSIHWRV